MKKHNKKEITMADFNCSLTEQYIDGVIERHRDIFPGELLQERPKAFVILAIKSYLGVDEDIAIDCYTDGGYDFGIDGIFLGNEDNGEVPVTIFQCKYKHNLEGDSNFPANGVEKAISTTRVIFDPQCEIKSNDRLAPKIEEIRSLVRDGYIPIVNFVLCNNGAKWVDAADQIIANAGLPAEQVRFTHFNHNNIVESIRKKAKIDETLHLTGKATLEEFNYKRVLIGKVALPEIDALVSKHGSSLLEKNIRNYLGLKTNQVNASISKTILSAKERENFYFFNNGVTIICNKFSHNALQSGDFNVRLQGMQIINGGQTCRTIAQTLLDNPDVRNSVQNTYLMVRIYELSEVDENFVSAITYATNNQNPVDLRDLHANDTLQQGLELGLKELGYTYKRKRDTIYQRDAITSLVAAEAILAVWRKRPHQAKFMRNEHFGKLYNFIFSDTTPSQLLLAVKIFRYVENERKRSKEVSYAFIPYASHYISMYIGNKFLSTVKLQSVNQVTNKNIQELLRNIESNIPNLYADALTTIDKVLNGFYKDSNLSLQQLSATFRRGDLITAVLNS